MRRTPSYHRVHSSPPAARHPALGAPVRSRTGPRGPYRMAEVVRYSELGRYFRVPHIIRLIRHDPSAWRRSTASDIDRLVSWLIVPPLAYVNVSESVPRIHATFASPPTSSIVRWKVRMRVCELSDGHQNARMALGDGRGR